MPAAANTHDDTTVRPYSKQITSLLYLPSIINAALDKYIYVRFGCLAYLYYVEFIVTFD